MSRNYEDMNILEALFRLGLCIIVFPLIWYLIGVANDYSLEQCKKVYGEHAKLHITRGSTECNVNGEIKALP